MQARFGTLIFAAVICMQATPLVHAEDVDFNSSVTSSCTITVTRGGTLDPRSNFTRLTSRSGPGTPGRATVFTTGSGFTASVDAPSSFDSKPAADTTPETFRAWHRSRGATSYNATQAPQTLNAGTNNLRVHMDARKTGTDVFEAGNYSASVVLRCE